MPIQPKNIDFQVPTEKEPNRTAKIIEFPKAKPVAKTAKPPTNTVDQFSHVTKQPLAYQRPAPFTEQQSSETHSVGTIMSQEPEAIAEREAQRVTQMKAQIKEQKNPSPAAW